MPTLDHPPGALEGALRLLADPTRLRILALLEGEELSVGELCRALELAQSRVSNHLRHLREAGLLVERHAGTSTFLRLVPPARAGSLARRLWLVLREELGSLPEHAADRVRLAQLLDERRSSEDALFERLAGEWDKIAGAFESGRARERAAAHLLPAGFAVADLGCGTGYMAAALLGRVARLVCVDRSRAMLEATRKRLEALDPAAGRPGGTQLELHQADLDRLPLADGELDGAVVGLVLHHLEDPGPGLSEVARVLKPGGTLAVLELAPHKEAWMRAELGDRHLGLEPKDVLAALTRAGFEDLLLDPVEDRYRPRRAGAAPDDASPSLSLYIVRGRKPRP